jgi:hypothetical protein
LKEKSVEAPLSESRIAARVSQRSSQHHQETVPEQLSQLSYEKNFDKHIKEV